MSRVDFDNTTHESRLQITSHVGEPIDLRDVAPPHQQQKQASPDLLQRATRVVESWAQRKEALDAITCPALSRDSSCEFTCPKTLPLALAKLQNVAGQDPPPLDLLAASPLASLRDSSREFARVREDSRGFARVREGYTDRFTTDIRRIRGLTQIR